MSTNICNSCGANLIYKDGRWVCPACGLTRAEDISNEESTLLYNALQKLRMASFDDAEDAYRDIVDKYPKNSEARWGLVLAKYGIKYEDDYDGKRLPTYYATSIESVLTDKDYLAAVDLCADASRRAYYVEQGKLIEKIRIEWLEKASQEPQYDVFLCFKDSDKANNMERTDDSIEVSNLYTHLTELGYHVFYSRVSLRDKVSEKYEPYIYNALNTASVMIVYGSRIEYFTSVWMKNEWTRFFKRMRDGLKVEGSLVVACEGVNPAELPKPLNAMQVMDATSKTFYGDLERHIEKVISIAKRPKATVDRIEISGAIGKKKTSIGNEIKTIKIGGDNIVKKKTVVLDSAVTVREIGQYEVPALTADENVRLKNIYRSIENGFFDNAGKAVAEVLAKNKFSSQALLASLLVHYEARSLDDLRTKMTEVDDFKLVHTVIEYNEKEIGESIIAILCDLIRLAIANGEYDKAVSYLKEVIVYNSDSVSALKTELRPIATKLLTASPEASEQIYDVLVDAYQDADSYIDYLQEYVNDCLKSGNFSIAKKYNNRVVELDDGNLPATLAEMYIEVSAKNFDDFCRLADEFDNFSYFDHAIGHFDKGEIAECFEKVQQIFFRAIQLQLSGDTICRWFDFIAKYEFVGRNDFLTKATAALASIEDTVSRSSLFDRVVKCIDGNDVETHINMRLDFAKRLQVTGEFSLAINYYKQVLDIEEGNVSALWGIILCLCEANRETDISDRIDRFTYFTELENLLKYCPDLATRTEYLNKILNAVIFKAGTLSNKEHMVKLSKVLEGTIKYYPEDGNAQLIQYIRKFADCCKNNSVFDLAEKYYATILTLDKMHHSAYWGLLQVKLKCRNNDDLIKQPTLITETSEFNSAVSAAGDDDRSAEKYFSVARNQKDYLEEQEKKAAAAKKRKRKIRFASGIAAVLAVVCLIGFVAFKYISIESALKYDDGVGGYTVTTGKFFKEGSVIIPEIYDGKPVTKIADGAFEGNTYLTSVTIPSTVTEIGENAFKGCTNLREIAFANVKPNASLQANARFAYAGTYTLSVGTPTYTLTNASNQKITTVQSGVKKIGAKAFYCCTNLAFIDASRATEIGEEAFAGCSSLHSIVFGNNLLSLSNGTFSGCSSLKLIDLPSSLTTIGDRCFENCTGFTNFLVPATITTVGDAILTGCANLTELVVEERSTMEGFSQNWKNGVPDTVKTSIGFRIALDYNHATIPGKDAVSVKQDGGYQLPIPERTGYKFLGWYDSMTNGNRLTDENGQSLSAYAFGRSVTVYALWEANINEVVFMPNGGEGDPFTQGIATDASAALSKNTFTKKGYTFAGWGTTTYSVNYTDEAEYVMGSNSTYTLYAIWKANENTLHFDSNGGNGGSMSDMKIASDAKAALLKNGFTRSGYEFAGWAESANGSKVYSDGETYSMGLESSYTLYALWKPKTYSITYKLNGGQTSESNKISYDIESDSFSLVNPVREGYIFVGWSGTGLDGNENLSVSVSTGAYGDLTFTANWKAIEYQITYDLDGGQNNSGNPGTYTIEQLITLLPPTKTGYTFKGWSDGGVIAKGSTGEKTFTATWEISGYKINYNLNGGINHPSNPDEYNVDNDTITLKEPTRVGYTFKGWSDGGVIEHGSTGVKTFTASWEVITYKITYILGGGVNAPENSGTYTVEDVITLVSPTKAGYRFDGWSNGGLIEKGSTGDKEFTATWTIIDYKISYELNGGTNHAKNPESYTVNSADITLNEPTRPGYRFVGWSDGGTIPHGSTGDKTFVAQWEANSYTIKYDPNGGNGTMSDSIMHTDESAKLSQNTYARTGYVFAGWATEQGGVVQYKDQSLYTMGAESEVILYAVWTPVTYRISYDLAGGNETSNPGEYNIETDDITLVIPTRPGYTFTGWSGTGIDGKQKLVTISKGSIGERQYTANWEANRNTIVFHPNGGTGTMENQTIPTDESQTLTRNGFTKAGYTFVGWAISCDTAVKYQDGASYTMGVEETYHLYAIWTPNQNTLTFDGNGATSGSMDALRKYSDEKFTLPGVGFSKTGYSFKGWSKTPNGTVLVQDGADYTMDCQDQVILYAVWGINQYTITIEANGGKGTTKITQDYNTVVKAPTLTRSGYAFEEWFADADFKTVYNFATMPADNITVYVKWQLSNFGGEQTGIRTPAELDAIRNNLAGNYYLENDIDMAGMNWMPIGSDTDSFTGNFDGKGKRIKNLTISSNANKYIGLFGYAETTLKNVFVCDAVYNIQQRTFYIGGIAGRGDCYNCSWSGTMTLKSSIYVGGIVALGNAQKCVSTGTIKSNAVNGINSTGCYNYIGGIVGSGSAKECHSEVSITASNTVIDNNRYGSTNNMFVGMICGQGTDVVDCYSLSINHPLCGSVTKIVRCYGYALSKSSISGENCLLLNDTTHLKSRQYLVETLGWDESVWCFGNDYPTLYIDGYIRVIYENVSKANNDSNPSGFKVGSDSFILKIPYRAGYTFEGWYTDAAFTNKITEVKGLTTTLTVYAKWTANTYTITLNPVDAELTETTVSVRYDSDYRLPVPTLPGYTFAGWYDGTGSTAMAVTDADGNSLAIWSFVTNGTLYAKWNANSNTLILTDGTHKIVLSGKTAEWIRLPANTFTKENYEFKGWATIQDGKVEYYNRDLFPMGPKISYTLYAVWVESAETTDFSDYTPISSAQDFNNIRGNLSGKYYLTCDIDMSGYEWIPIGNSSYDQYTGKDTGKAFGGVFDGNGYTIYNYSQNKAFVVQSQIHSFHGDRRYYMYGAGLFGYNQGTIRNLKVVNANVDVLVTTANPAGFRYNEFDFYSGIICSMNYGHIENCFAQGTLKASTNLPAKNFESRKDGNWFANAEMGGISWNRGTVKGCSAEVGISLVCPSITSYMSVLLGKVVPDTENITSISAQNLEELYAVGYIRYKQSNGYYKYQEAKWHAIVIILPPMENREGYSFVGWSLSEGGEVSYRVGDEVFIPSDQKSLTLYSVWESSTNKTLLGSNRGSEIIKTQFAQINSIATLRICTYLTLANNSFSNGCGEVNGDVTYRYRSSFSAEERTKYYN